MQHRYLRIALPGPFAHYFDYLPPTGLTTTDCQPGCRIAVPFARTHKIGVIVDRVTEIDIPASKVRRATQILDTAPLLTAEHLDFLTWTADYYHYAIGEVMLAALPIRLRKQRLALPLSDLACRLIVDPSTAQAAVSKAPRQQALLNDLLLNPQDSVSLGTLQAQHKDAKAVLDRLQHKGLISLSRQTPQPKKPHYKAAKYPLNAEQQTAIQAVQSKLGQFATFLLEGVTGSGKTEIYLQLAKHVLQQNRSVLLLVPEIALTPQLEQRFNERFSNGVSVMHSGLNDGARERAWQKVRLGLTPFVVGTRSMILNPMPNLGIIIVDEEHEPAYKQQDGLRYSARDMAIIRARRANCPVLLGTATPSLESLHNVQHKGYQQLTLNQRAGGAQAPKMSILDIRDQPLQVGISEPLLEALRTTLAAGEQAMVYINRRGYAPVLTCYSCGWVSECSQCDAYQTVHRAAGQLRCHHCGAKQHLPTQCPACEQIDIHPLGQGTEKVSDYLQAQFPDIPLLRIDRDATSRKGSLETLLAQVHQAKVALLVGTQMLAKGHHFPRVTLVGILDADGGLYSADFRGSERMAQLIMQVAGRAGRGERPGRVLIQTRQPEHPMLLTLLRDGYAGFAKIALAERQAAGYPPYSRHILIRAEATQPEPPERYLQRLVTWIQQQATPVECWGPVPAPMARRVGKYHAQLLLQATDRQPLHNLAHQISQYLREQPPLRGVQWSLDVDPL
jgi:primosomal protein N' (replication factor Y)